MERLSLAGVAVVPERIAKRIRSLFISRIGLQATLERDWFVEGEPARKCGRRDGRFGTAGERCGQEHHAQDRQSVHIPVPPIGYYEVSVRRLSALPQASSGPSLAAAPLLQASDSFLWSFAGDFHPISKCPCRAYTPFLSVFQTLGLKIRSRKLLGLFYPLRVVNFPLKIH